MAPPAQDQFMDLILKIIEEGQLPVSEIPQKAELTAGQLLQHLQDMIGKPLGPKKKTESACNLLSILNRLYTIKMLEYTTLHEQSDQLQQKHAHLTQELNTARARLDQVFTEDGVLKSENEQIKRLEAELSQVKEDNKRILVLQAEIAQLKLMSQQTAALQAEVNQLKQSGDPEKVEELQERNHKLNEALTHQTEMNAKISGAMLDQDKQIDELKGRLREVETQLNKEIRLAKLQQDDSALLERQLRASDQINEGWGRKVEEKEERISRLSDQLRLANEKLIQATVEVERTKRLSPFQPATASPPNTGQRPSVSLRDFQAISEPTRVSSQPPAGTTATVHAPVPRSAEFPGVKPDLGEISLPLSSATLSADPTLAHYFPQDRQPTQSSTLGASHSMAQPNRTRAVPLPRATREDLRKRAKLIRKHFVPRAEGSDIEWYLSQVELFLDDLEDSVSNKIDLISFTSDPEVNRFIKRQSDAVQSDWPALRKALIDEYAETQVLDGFLAAANVKQRLGESIFSYNQRLRKAFFGNVNKVGMEDDPSYKAVFVNNLHGTVRKHVPYHVKGKAKDVPMTTLKELTKDITEQLRRDSEDNELLRVELKGAHAQRDSVDKTSGGTSWRKRSSSPDRRHSSPKSWRKRSSSPDRRHSSPDSWREKSSSHGHRRSPPHYRGRSTSYDRHRYPPDTRRRSLSRESHGQDSSQGRPRESSPEGQTILQAFLSDLNTALSELTNRSQSKPNVVHKKPDTKGKPLKDVLSIHVPSNKVVKTTAVGVGSNKPTHLRPGGTKPPVPTHQADNASKVLNIKHKSPISIGPNRACKPLGVSRPAPIIAEITKRGLHNKPSLQVTLERQFIQEALLDTAADITVMSKGLFNELQAHLRRSGREIRLSCRPITIRPYTKEGTTLMDQVALCHIQIGPMSIEHPVYLSDVDQPPLLIGIDLLDRLQAVIDLEDGVVSSRLTVPKPLDPAHLSVGSCNVLVKTPTIATAANKRPRKTPQNKRAVSGLLSGLWPRSTASWRRHPTSARGAHVDNNQ